MPARSFNVTAAMPITMAVPSRPAAASVPAPPPALDLHALIARHQAGLWRYVRALGASPELADDVVQDAFVAAWNHNPEIAFVEAKAWMGWLRVVARNRLITIRRREKRQVLLDEFDAIEHLFASLSPDGSDTWLDALDACMGAKIIDERSATILEMRYRDGMSAKDTAAILNMGESNVAVTAHRAMAKIRACVERRLSHE